MATEIQTLAALERIAAALELANGQRFLEMQSERRMSDPQMQALAADVQRMTLLPLKRLSEMTTFHESMDERKQ